MVWRGGNLNAPDVRPVFVPPMATLVTVPPVRKTVIGSPVLLTTYVPDAGTAGVHHQEVRTGAGIPRSARG
jgi:hypothetical protein